MITIFQILFVAALIAGAVWWWQGRRTRATPGADDDGRLDPPAPLVGCTGTVTSEVLDARRGEVRIVDGDGRVHEQRARLETDAEPLRRGEEVLVVEEHGEGRPLIVTPSELPRLAEEPI